jgi:glycerate 2-kinase
VTVCARNRLEYIEISQLKSMTFLPNPRHALLAWLTVALDAVDGARAVRRALSARPLAGPVWIAAIGKAAESMTLGALDVLGGACRGGMLVTKPGHADPEPLRGLGIEVHFGGHPLPDAGSLAAGEHLLTCLDRLPAETRLLFLLSGGASALIEAPISGLGLAELRAINAWLLGSGLPISAMNGVRQSVSRLKAGGLLRPLGGRPVRQLVISDVPGDVPSVIGSGPLVPRPDLADQVGRLALPDWLADWVARGLAARGTLPEQGPAVELVATLSLAKVAVAAAAESSGWRVWRYPDPVEGEAADQGRALARTLIAGAPGLHVWGGETTVRLPEHPGRGGRNQHLALAAAIELAGRDDVWLLSAGTDGGDGPTEDAGALVDGGTLERGELAGLDAHACLVRADSGRFLEASGDLIHTGPTGTNVMDLILGYKSPS